ncbi:hypothetical protein B0I35DRAFT_20067 [Stachybotrys elegans]|uniref:Uncharacterized protein n=1 Tax=Stachybotrys elegans TaxID=80388 RepID=A0A8K0T457_9HYPO|nr:hypothetical protein B0I35DRAFT_20067 [Stachybotrys elegans]
MCSREAVYRTAPLLRSSRQRSGIDYGTFWPLILPVDGRWTSLARLSIADYWICILRE